MTLFDSPLLEALGDSRCVLIAGAGGGFDVFCGLPLFLALRERGVQVYLANLTFSSIDRRGCRELAPALVEVSADSEGPEAYFPELHLCRALRRRGIEAPVFCFERTGARPIADAYQLLVERLDVDAVVLIDGGTDSLMRGDEVGLGTPQEDIASLVAVDQLSVPTRLLICTAFGVDAFHGVCHADFLEAVAALTREGAYLGAFALTAQMTEVQTYRDLTQEVFAAMPQYPSIVSASVLSAIDGRFGNYHMTERTRGSELFINPLMGLYWIFELEPVVRRNLYAAQVRESRSYQELSLAIEMFRDRHGRIGKWRELPV